MTERFSHHPSGPEGPGQGQPAEVNGLNGRPHPSEREANPTPLGGRARKGKKGQHLLPPPAYRVISKKDGLYLQPPKVPLPTRPNESPEQLMAFSCFAFRSVWDALPRRARTRIKHHWRTFPGPGPRILIADRSPSQHLRYGFVGLSHIFEFNTRFLSGLSRTDLEHQIARSLAGPYLRTTRESKRVWKVYRKRFPVESPQQEGQLSQVHSEYLCIRAILLAAEWGFPPEGSPKASSIPWFRAWQVVEGWDRS